MLEFAKKVSNVVIVSPCRVVHMMYGVKLQFFIDLNKFVISKIIPKQILIIQSKFIDTIFVSEQRYSINIVIIIIVVMS